MTITRFAPSPTGLLHLGSAYSALFSVHAAGPGGRFLLRVEDIDQTRCRPQFTTAMLDDLRWLGLTWEEPVRVQSDHFSFYQGYVDQLRDMGLIYPCFCTRSEIARAIETSGAPTTGPDGPVYPGTCRGLAHDVAEDRLSAGEAHAFRLNIDVALKRVDAVQTPLRWYDTSLGWRDADPARFGDVVIARKDTPTSYHLSVTVDDALQGITLVTRGMDLFDATDIHRLLQAVFDLPTPHYSHHPLLLGSDGKRLAKRDGSISIRSLRESGQSREDVLAAIGWTEGG